MALTEEEKKALIAYRKEKADSVYVEAEDNAKLGHWSLAANRLYYALFHVSTALLVKYGYNAKTHAGVICSLGQHFVETGVLNSSDGKLISRLQSMRQSGDYDDLFDWSQEDVEPYFEPTRALIEKIKGLL